MSITLNNNLKMPLIGYGTSALLNPNEKDILKNAVIEIGYRHIDTASIYKNEEQIGEVLLEIFATGKIKREELFITTKVWCDQKENIQNSLKESLKKLQLEYVDLYLIHWPVAIQTIPGENAKILKLPMHVQWKQMEDCVKMGLTKSIGVSNFNFQLLNDLLCYAEIKPVCNQIELNPYLTQFNLVEWLKKEHIVPVAYSPLGRPSEDRKKDATPIFDSTVLFLANKYSLTPAQVLLNWGLVRGHSVIPKTANFLRAKENFDCQKVVISDQDILLLNSLHKNSRIFSNITVLIGIVPMFD